MPGKKRGRSTPPTAVAPAVGSPLHYKYFLDNNIPKKRPANLGAAEVRRWPDVLTGIKGQIQNEIAQKFNLHNILGGIKNVKYGPVGANYAYFANKRGEPQLNLAPLPSGLMTDGANPTRTTHELIHANDHQIDQLNPKVWGHLGSLANTGNGATPTTNGTSMPDFATFQRSLTRIQDKIDPTKAFSLGYNNPTDPNNNTYNQNQLQFDIQDANGIKNYVIPTMQGTQNPDWLKLMQDIRAVTAPITFPAGSNLPNPNYKLPHASEYPAFLSERLEIPLDASDKRGNATAPPGPAALSLPEARFLHSTLGDMDTAYPAAQYSTMNQHIHQRRNSIEQAYYPPTVANPGGGVPVGQHFSRGGHVKAATKRRGLSDYLRA